MNFSEYVKGNSLSLSKVWVDINQLISFLQENKNITELSLKDCDIGDEGAKALANGNLTNLTQLCLWSNHIGEEGAKALANGNLTNLTQLFLMRNNIGDAGVKALANGNLTNLTVFCCTGDNFGAKEAKALAESEECWEFIDKFASTDGNNITGLCHHLKELWSQARKESNGNVSKLDKKVAKDFFFHLVRYNYSKEVIEPFLDDFDKYPFNINSRNEQGHTLAHFYNHSPEMKKFLFNHGFIPEKERNQRRDDERIVQDNQSVHASPIVKRTNFLAKKLVESTKYNEKQLKQAADSYLKSIERLKQYQNDPVRLGLLNLTDNEKRSVMEKTLNGHHVPNDKGFIKTVIDKAKQTLEQEYLRKNSRGEYNGGYSTSGMQYDYARDDAKITIPESIGRIKLLIDNFFIPLKEKKELLVTLMEQNPKLVREKLPTIRKELGNSDTLNKRRFEKTELYVLLNNIDDSKTIDKLFNEISGLDIEKVWREQKEFVLLKQIYIAATTYGKNRSAGNVQKSVSSRIFSSTQFSIYLERKYQVET